MSGRREGRTHDGRRADEGGRASDVIFWLQEKKWVVVWKNQSVSLVKKLLIEMDIHKREYIE